MVNHKYNHVENRFSKLAQGSRKYFWMTFTISKGKLNARAQIITFQLVTKFARLYILTLLSEIEKQNCTKWISKTGFNVTRVVKKIHI